MTVFEGAVDSSTDAVLRPNQASARLLLRASKLASIEVRILASNGAVGSNVGTSRTKGEITASELAGLREGRHLNDG